MGHENLEDAKEWLSYAENDLGVAVDFGRASCRKSDSNGF